jgi:hypothetical protein
MKSFIIKMSFSIIGLFTTMSMMAQSSQVFNYTGVQQTFIVPNGVTSITVDAYGAQGGSNWSGNVNYGGYVQADIPVTPGTTLYIYVGGQPSGLAGGFNGGGIGETGGAGGGGASDIRIGGTTYADRVVVAGGAGGAGTWFNLHVVGGLGGGLIGGNGYRDNPSTLGGDGGTQTSSGNGTCVSFNNPVVAGGFGFGGAPSGCGCQGYGGGGGWYGGAGSGNCRGGGGGSSYTIPGATNVTHTQGIRMGDGQITLTWTVTAPPATGLNFDGANDWVDIGTTTPALPQGNAPWTAEAWVKTTQTSIGNIISWGNRTSNNRVGVAVRSNGAAFIGEFNDLTPGNGALINDGQWHHVAVVCNGTTSNNIQIYVDGQLKSTGLGSLNVSGQNLRIGRISSPSDAEYFNGSMDEVRIWNTARTAQEIMDGKDCELVGNEAGLIAYYDFSNGIDGGNNAGLTTLSDQTSNGNDGTLQNFALSGPTSNWVEGAAISGVCAPTTCTATASFRLYGQNKLWKNAGASDDNVFYYGATQTKKVSASATGGVGPYTYTWSNSEGYQLKSQSADGRSIRLFEPQGPSYMVCEITDVGAGCTFKDSVFVDWTDVFWCGTTGGTPADFWKLTMCVDGVTSCISQSAAKAALKDPNVTASLGACSTPKTDLTASAKDFVVYPNPSNGLINVNFTSNTEATASIEVVDMNGRVLQTNQVQTNIGIVEANLDLSGLANGMYFVRLVTAEATSTQRVQLVK